MYSADAFARWAARHGFMPYQGRLMAEDGSLYGVLFKGKFLQGGLTGTDIKKQSTTSTNKQGEKSNANQ